MEPGYEDEDNRAVAETKRQDSRLPTRTKGKGYHQVVMSGLNNDAQQPGDENFDGHMPVEEYGHTLAVVARQRLWIRGLCVVALALAVDVAALGIYIFRDNGSTNSSAGNANRPLSSSSSPSRIFDIPHWIPLPPSNQRLTKLAFGSCSSQFMPQPYWDTILRYDPDIVILGGDNVYGDCHEDTCQNLQYAYRNWTQHASFQGAIQNVPVIATLDDHDYGTGDADVNNPYKKLAKDFFHEFYSHLTPEVPKGEEDGVYQQYTWGPPGKRVQVILLDTRFARSKFQPNSDDPNAIEGPSEAPYKPTLAEEQHMLSERQWKWLEEQISKPDVQIRLLISSIQVLNDGTGFECWRMLPKERRRLYDLIHEQCNSPIYFLSGDRHMGGFYEYKYDDDEEETRNANSTNYNSNDMVDTLVEVTASSWTHTVPYGAFDNCTDASTCDEIDPRRIGDFVRENHFATIDIDWEQGNVTLAIRRAETVPGSQYSKKYHKSQVSAGQILQSRFYNFL